MWDIIINKNIIPSFILYPDYYITAITCKKIKNLQYNIKLINEFQNKVKNDRKIIVIDTESYENDLNIITEFGWCVFNVDGKIIKEQHFIVKEYYNLRNGNYVPDNKDHYIFGKSQHKSLNEINKILQDEINCADFIIGYGIHNDIKYLKNSGIEFSKFSFIDGEIFNPNRKYIIEMYDFHSAYFLKAPSILKYGLKDFQIKYKYLDNAGNDSHYIMKYFLKFIKNFNINSKKYSRILNINVPTNFSSYKYHKFGQSYIKKKNFLDLYDQSLLTQNKSMVNSKNSNYTINQNNKLMVNNSSFVKQNNKSEIVNNDIKKATQNDEYEINNINYNTKITPQNDKVETINSVTNNFIDIVNQNDKSVLNNSSFVKQNNKSEIVNNNIKKETQNGEYEINNINYNTKITPQNDKVETINSVTGNFIESSNNKTKTNNYNPYNYDYFSITAQKNMQKFYGKTNQYGYSTINNNNITRIVCFILIFFFLLLITDTVLTILKLIK